MATYTPNYNLYKPAGTDQFDNFLTEFGNNMDIIDQNLGGGGGSSTLAGLSDVNLTSPVTNDALIYDGAEWANSPLSAVAFSGDYSDLLNAPTIPTKTSDLNNDSDFVSDSAYVHTDNNFTNADVTKLSGIQAGAEVNVQSDWNEADNTADDYIKNKPTIPTNTSDLNNDSGFLDSSDITVTQVQTTGTKIATIDVDGNSTDLYAPNGGGGSYTEGDGIDITNNTISVDTTFTEASIRANIASGDSFSTILGKIKKWFTDIPNLFVDKTGDTMSGALSIRNSSATQLWLNRNHTSTSDSVSDLVIGNNIADGTAGVSRGRIRLYGKGSNYTSVHAPDSTADRTIVLPDASGTVALTNDLTNYVAKSGDTMTGDLTIKAALAVNRASTTQATFERDNSGTSSLSSIIYLGNNKAEGTAGCSDGVIRIYGKGSYYTTFDAPNSTANRKLTAPDKSGTIALTSDLPTVGTVSLSRAAGNQSMIANISHPTLNPTNAHILVSVSNSSNIDAPFNLKTYPFGSSYWTVDATRYSGTFASNATIEVTYQLIAT